MFRERALKSLSENLFVTRQGTTMHATKQAVFVVVVEQCLYKVGVFYEWDGNRRTAWLFTDKRKVCLVLAATRRLRLFGHIVRSSSPFSCSSNPKVSFYDWKLR